MSPKLRIPSRRLWMALVRVSLLGASLLALAVFGSMACEDNGIGRPCDILVDAGQSQAVYNPQALECPSRICLKPVNENSANVTTGPYCSATCSSDSDCSGQKKDMSDNSDHRCATGYACGVAFVVGALCCQKLCLCKDFLVAGAGLTTPTACDPKLNNGKTACDQ